MQRASRASARPRRFYPTVWAAGALLAACAAVLPSHWWIRTLDAVQKTRRYQAALNSLSQMQRERQRLVDELIRNRRLIAWREARLRDAERPATVVGQQAAFSSLSQTDLDAAECFDVSLAEDELDLTHSRERWMHLQREMSAMEDLIAAQEFRIRQMIERTDAR